MVMPFIFKHRVRGLIMMMVMRQNTIIAKPWRRCLKDALFLCGGFPGATAKLGPQMSLG